MSISPELTAPADGAGTVGILHQDDLGDPCHNPTSVLIAASPSTPGQALEGDGKSSQQVLQRNMEAGGDKKLALGHQAQEGRSYGSQQSRGASRTFLSP